MTTGRVVALLRLLADTNPDLADPVEAVRAGWVTVGGRVVTNPAARVARHEPVVVRVPTALRGEAKLGPALAAFDVAVDGRVALDLGAAAGGFTRILLAAGARRVYAVDAGHGQLLGSLRQHERVVNLENTNLGLLDPTLIPDAVDVVTADLSYLSLATALKQIASLTFAADADLVALVKPMFELALPEAPSDEPTLREALRAAVDGISAAGWEVLDTMPSPVTGSRGAVEFLAHARR